MSISNLLSYFNPFSYFPSKPILEEYEELSEPRWVVYGEEIRIIRHGEDLNYLVVDPISGKIIRQRYIDKYDFSADELIEGFKRLLAPEVLEDGRINFVRAYKSLLDGDNIITKNQWAVTMVDTLASNPNPRAFESWGGHAVLLIEKLENGVYTMLKAHLFMDEGKPTVGSEKITNFKYLDRIQEKTETWQVSAEKIKIMLHEIEEELSRQKRGKIGSLLTRFGRDSLLTRTKKIDGRLYPPDNCYTWAREKLKLAGIELISEDAIMITTPKSNIDPTALASKAAVYVVVTGIPFIKDPFPLNVTACIHERVGKRSWKAFSSLRNNTCTVNGKTFDNVVAKTNAYIEEVAFNKMKVERLLILIKIRNEQVSYVDITKDIKSYIYECIEPEIDSDDGWADDGPSFDGWEVD